MLILSVISAGVVAFTALSLARVNSIAFQGLNSSRTALTAQQYAEAEAAIIKSVDYSDVVAHNRAEIQNSDGFESEIVLSAESDYNDKLKQKTATINIYKIGESKPRVSYNVLKVNADKTDNSIPVGTIIAWGGSNPSIVVDNVTWLLCDGRSFSSSLFPKLAAALGTSNLPNLDGRFLEGNNAQPMRFKEAGLPEITGTFGVDSNSHGAFSGAFSYAGGARGASGGSSNNSKALFEASKSNPIYGSSETVQPASYTVRYYIKAV